jgi:hypothetical protein
MPERRLPDPFDGQPIVKTTVALRDVGDGLSEAVATDAQVLHSGETVTVVIEARVDHFVIKPLDKDDPGGPLVLGYVLKGTDRATITGAQEQVLAQLLDAQQQRNEQARGIERMVASDGELTEAARAQ